MKMKIKKENGVTLTALVVTVVMLIILTNVMFYKTLDTIHIKKLNDLYTDISLLETKVEEYYNEYGEIPGNIQYTNTSSLASVLSTNNDTGEFVVIDLEAMQGITLNYGRDYATIKNNPSQADNYDDVYIINKKSHNIFYVKGIQIKENNVTKTYYTDYTEPDETKVDLRYIDGILIPDGYYYIGKESDGLGNYSIVISTTKDATINNVSENQYIWQKQISYIDTVPGSIQLSNEQSENEFFKSVNHYKGYFKNKNKVSNIDVIYLSVKENKWSEAYTKNDKYVDKNGDIAIIPTGFRVSLAEGTNEIREGLVITDQIDQNGNSTGNEFVWIPVPDFDYFVRKDFSTLNINDEDFISTQATLSKYYEMTADGETVNQNASTDVKEVQELYKSVNDNKGFYIGRYETGITSNSERTSSSGTSATPVSKKDKYVYNYVQYVADVGNSILSVPQIARSMYSNSTLCYGVQWDAIMRWFNKDTICRNYLTQSSGKGNYNLSDIIKTGSNESYQIKNIYDIAGNVSEWTMETYDLDNKVTRGGQNGNNYSVSYRESQLENYKSKKCGFRVSLYIK